MKVKIDATPAEYETKGFDLVVSILDLLPPTEELVALRATIDFRDDIQNDDLRALIAEMSALLDVTDLLAAVGN